MRNFLNRFFRVSNKGQADRWYIWSVLGYAMFVHRIHTSDHDDAFHSHPWSGISFIFGSYTEEQLGKKPKLKRFFNYVRGDIPHRVTIAGEKPVYTIFIHGRRYNKWGVFRRDGTQLKGEPWRGVSPESQNYV